jgi:FkbM family methyltransferase
MTEAIPPNGETHPEIVASCHGIEVPFAPHLGPNMIRALQKGSYERREIEAAMAVIEPGARILELGAGSGFVGAAIARNCAPEAILAFEANPNLMPHIKRLYEVNGLQDVINVRHQIVWSETPTPDTITFHVRGNFLGSGITVVKNPEKATPVEVPVVAYSELRETFPHDVIVMDIEGAEREFLESADLTGVKTVIFETHRDIYGRDGMKACRRALDRAGFLVDSENCQGGVHVWRRAPQEDRPAAEETPQSAPPQGAVIVPEARVFTGEIKHLAQAIVVPERTHDTPLACGVLDADGAYQDLSRSWIRAFKSTQPPTLSADEPTQTLSGRHLYAGHLRGHFGHFLVESTARLWALGQDGIAPDSILYLPYGGKPRAAQSALRAHQMFFDSLGIEVPIQIIDKTTFVDDLILPELGFGWRARYAGSDGYRDFMRSRLKAARDPEGATDLYISRSRLRADKGHVIGEEVLEDNLARCGYEVFHPEKHDLLTQIARYRAARRIVALDGSALHLAAYVAEPETKVAIVLRRSKANHGDYTLQYQSFAGITPDILNAVRRDWAGGAKPRSDYKSVGELDFETIFRKLGRLGYVPEGYTPELPDTAEWERMITAFSDQRTDALQPLRPN